MRRHATLASVSKWPAHSIRTPASAAALLDDAAAMVVRASRMGADLVAFPEAFPQLGTGEIAAHAEPEEGGTLDAVREMAHRHRLYLVWPRVERDAAGVLHNASVLVGREGEVIGRYNKMFPTIGEMDAGIAPGIDCPCFETDFGRLAMCICFDLNFPEVRGALEPRRPDLVVFSSMYRGGIQCQEWALHLGCHFLTAISAELGRLVDPVGRVVATSTYEALLAQRVNMNKRQLHMDGNWDRMDDMLAAYGSDLTFELATQEARLVIGYEREDRDVDDIVREWSLEGVGSYLARARGARAAALEGRSGPA